MRVSIRTFYNPFGPPQFGYFNDTNNISFVTFLHVYGRHMLLPGDLEAPGWRAARQLKAHAEGANSKTQVLVTTHSPYFVDALDPEQVWLIDKGPDGATKAQRSADMPGVRDMITEGIPLGSLWYSQHFGRVTRS